MPTPEQRKLQADLVRSLVDQWEKAANATDTAENAFKAAQADQIAKYRAFNAVSWQLLDHSGATDEQKIAAYQLKIASDAATALLPTLQATSTAAYQARGAIELAADKATDQLKDDPGAVEKVA